MREKKGTEALSKKGFLKKYGIPEKIHVDNGSDYKVKRGHGKQEG